MFYVGYYMLADSNAGQLGEIAIFSSPTVSILRAMELTFKAFLYASSQSKSPPLQVFRLSPLGSTEKKLIGINFVQMDKWIEYTICLQPGTFRIEFHAVRGIFQQSDIALDNIELQNVCNDEIQYNSSKEGKCAM